MPPQSLKLPPGATLVSDGPQASIPLPPGATLVNNNVHMSQPSFNYQPAGMGGAQPTGIPGASQELIDIPRNVLIGGAKSLGQTVFGTSAGNDPNNIGTQAALARQGIAPTPDNLARFQQQKQKFYGDLQPQGASQKAGAALEQTGEMFLTGGPLKAGAEELLSHAPQFLHAAIPGARIAAEAVNTAENAEAHGQDPNLAALAGAGGAALSEALPPSLSFLRGALANRMGETPPQSQFTRQEILDAARQHGVNLDISDATGSPVAGAIKRVNQYSLAGRGSYENNTTKNLQSLEAWAESEAGKYAPNSTTREALGGQIQSSLQQDLAQRKAAASQAFNDLDQRVGQAPVDVTNSVESAAKSILQQNQAYYKSHPELLPKQAWAILQDLAERPTLKAAVPAQAGFGGRLAQPAVQAPKNIMSWSELHQLRSDLMDVYRNNPDLVKGRAQAWLQQMVSKIDNAMTSGASALSPSDQAAFRQANSEWEGIKGTYDNPQSPIYHAVRSQFPSQVPGMLSKGSPELAQQVRQTLGNLEGPFQRQFVENLLNGKDGVTLDLKGLNARVSRIPQDTLESMIGQQGASDLRKLAKVAQTVTNDTNPSGTAKHILPGGEVAAVAMNPKVGLPALAANYAAGKAMTSNSILDYLIRRGVTTSRVGPKAAALAGGRFAAAKESQK